MRCKGGDNGEYLGICVTSVIEGRGWVSLAHLRQLLLKAVAEPSIVDPAERHAQVVGISVTPDTSVTPDISVTPYTTQSVPSLASTLSLSAAFPAPGNARDGEASNSQPLVIRPCAVEPAVQQFHT